MAGGRPAAGADDGGGGATAARRRLPYAAALCAFALAGGAAVRLQRPVGLGSPASAPRSSRGASSPGGADRAARRPARAAARRSAARLDRDGGGGDDGPSPLDEIEVISTEAPTLAPSNCSLSYSAFAESLETEVYGSCPWNAAAATAGEQLWFEDCLAVLNGTIAQCAFQGCATCGHYATCGDLEASPAPYADCVTCPDGYEVDVVYEDCSGACVLEGFAVNPAATCLCAAEMSAALLFDDGAVGAATCAPSVAPTAFDGSTDVTYFATSAVALDGITPDAITYDAGAVADIEAALVIALAPYVNGSAFVTSLTASSANASTLIGFDFYHWASVAGDGGDAELANASAAFASDYYDAATTAVYVGALEDALAAAATTATVKAATVDVMTSLEALDTTTVTWARGQDLETDSTADVATALEVVVSSALVFSGVDSDTFNDDVDAVAEFKDVIAALWPNVTADYVYEVSASLDGSLASIAYSFYDYFWLASDAAADDAAAAAAAYVAAYAATVVEAATSGDLQTLVDDATAGRRRLSSTAFDGARVSANETAAAAADTTSDYSLLNGGGGPTAAPTSVPASGPTGAPTPPPTYEPTYNPSYAPSTYEPSSMPTETPTYAPSYVPTDGACDADYCWADETVAEFGCSDNTHVFPVQIMRLSDDDEHYSVLELEYEEGNYDLMYDIEYFDGHINAAAMFVTASEDAFFSFASFGGYLCRFDESHAVCFATPLASDSPNAAAIIGNTYYYAKNFGNNIQNSHIYWVGDIHTDRPDFHDGHEFTMSPELYKSSVLDFVAVEEYGAEMIVDMYDEDGTYLIGIALGYEVVVVHVNRATLKPDKYAVLDAVVDWGDADDHSDDDNSFGAAFAYKLLRHADLYASYRLFFASNEGYGIMELATGFEIPDDCWNEGDDVENHAKCDATVALNYLGPSEPTHYNDGLNCPNGDFSGVLAPTAAPTEEPCTGRLCWDDVTVDEFDCETNYNPVQVMRYDDASLYGAYELNFDDGAYHLLYELDYFDGHINAVALYDGGKQGYYAMGSFGGYLCRFDAAAKVCFDDALEFSSPNVGAIVDKRYYYAKNLGEADDNGEIFWVDLIHTDEPEFYADSAFAVAPSLYDGAVLDFSGVEEDGDELFDDRYADAGYLVGLSTDFELLVVHLSGQSGYPDAYAVFDSQVDFDGFDPADDDTGGFGASFVYNANGDTKIYFTANSGQGLFELALPVAVPDSCWNAGFDTDAHGVCDVVVGIRRVSASAPTNYNDGMNCPEFFEAAPSTEPTPEPTTPPEPTQTPSLCPTYAPSVSAAPTAEPTIRATLKATTVPTSAPTSEAAARWSDASIDVFDCEAYQEPIQVLKYDGADTYTVRELDIDTGVYSEVEDLSWFDGHINAAAIFTGGDPTDLGSSNYAMASFGGYLCRFDTSSKVCFDTPLEYESPNVGAIVGTNYYYAKNVGRDGGEGFYYVGEINGDAPFFYEDATFGVSEDLYTGAVLDVAAVEEHDGDTKVIDGEGGRGYLVGLGGDYELLVVRLGEETGEPEAYAVLESSVEWGDDLESYDDGETSFGAAYAYLDIVGSEYATRAFFSSNTGAGMFELEFPIYVPKTCWNEGFSYDDHEVCSNTVSLAYVGPSEATSSNDGMNCPISLDLTSSTAAPTAPPDPTPAPSLAPSTALPSGAPTHPSPMPSAPPSTPPTPYPSLGPDACGDGEVLTSLRFFPDVADWTGVTITAYNATSGPTSANALDVDAFVAAGTDRVYKCAEATSCVLLEFAFPDAATAGDLAYEATAPDEEVYVSFEYGEAVQYFSYCLEDGAIARAPTSAPTASHPPTPPPSAPPTGAPAPRPTRPPTSAPTTSAPTAAPTAAPSTAAPSAPPSPSPSEAPTTSAPSTEAPTRSPIVSAPPTETFLPTAAPTYTVAPTAAPTLSCPEGGQWVLSTSGITCATECADRYTRTSNAIHDAVVSEVDTVDEVSALVDDLSGGLITCSEELSVISGLAYAPYVDFEYVDEYGDPSCGAHFRRSEFNVDTTPPTDTYVLCYCCGEMPSPAPTTTPPSARPSKIPTAAPSEAPTTAKPSTVAPTDMPLVSEPPTTTPAPSPAPTATAAPTAAPTAACQDTANWIVSDDLSCVDACEARGAYTDDGIRKSAWSQVDKLRELGELVYELTGVECSYVSSEVTDDPNAPYFEYDADNEGSNKYACYAKDGGDVGNDAPSEGMYLLCYCCGELPTPAPSYPPTDAPTLEPSTSHPTYAPTVSLAPTTYEHWFENTYSYSYTHAPSYDPTVYTSLAPTTSETVSGYYVVYVYYDFGVDADDEGDAAAFGETVVGVSDIVVGTEEVTLDLTTTDDANADDARRLEEADGGDDGDDYVASAYAGVATVVVSAEYHESTDAAAKIAEAMTAALEDGSFIDLFIDEVRATGGALAELSDEELEAGVRVDATLAALNSTSAWYPPPTGAPSYPPTYAPSAPSYAPSPMPSPAPSTTPTTAKPSARPTTATPSAAPSVSPPPSAAPTVACDDAKTWVPSGELTCEAACEAVGTYTSPAIAMSGAGRVDTLDELNAVVLDAMGIECDAATSYISAEPFAPYVDEDAKTCVGKEVGAPFANDAPEDGKTLLCYCCGELPTAAPTFSPSSDTGTVGVAADEDDDDVSTASAGSSDSNGADTASMSGLNLVIGIAILCLFLGVLGIGCYQYLAKKKASKAGDADDLKFDGDLSVDVEDGALGSSDRGSARPPPTDDDKSVASSQLDSDVFFNRLMQDTSSDGGVPPTPSGEESKYADEDDRPSDVADDEWDAMLNDVDDEESTETWNEDLSSMLLFKLAKADGNPEGFATRANLANKLHGRPDLVDMLGLRGILGDEIDFLLRTVESADGTDLVSRSQFLKVLEQFRKDSAARAGPLQLEDAPPTMPPAPPGAGDAQQVDVGDRLPAPPDQGGAPLAAEVAPRVVRERNPLRGGARKPLPPPAGGEWSPTCMFEPKYETPGHGFRPRAGDAARPPPSSSSRRKAKPAPPATAPPRRGGRRSASPQAPQYVSGRDWSIGDSHIIAPEDVDEILDRSVV